MPQDSILNRRAQVRDVEVPGGADKGLVDLIDKVIGELTEIKENKERPIKLKFFRLVFRLLAKLGVHGTVFQTGHLKDEKKPEEKIPFIFSGAYELKKDDKIYFDLSKGKFKAVVIGKTGEIDKICNDLKVGE